jgi:hypothetical protein
MGTSIYTSCRNKAQVVIELIMFLNLKPMWPVILRLVVVGVGGYIIKELLTSNSKEPDGKVNCHEIFLVFHENISIPKAKLQKLIQSRKALQKRIVEYFRLIDGIPLPKFYIQGSYKMGTMVLTKDGTYDVDLGVYFLTKPGVEPFTLQKWVLESLVGQTTGGVQHRNRCVRVVYKGDFDIDLPVYYMSSSDKHPYLAAKTGWIESDPKELCDWFQSKIDESGQLLRIVKYFKIWADNRPRKMPSGIAFTVWAAENYKADTRGTMLRSTKLPKQSGNHFGGVSLAKILLRQKTTLSRS